MNQLLGGDVAFGQLLELNDGKQLADAATFPDSQLEAAALNETRWDGTSPPPVSPTWSSALQSEEPLPVENHFQRQFFL